MPDQRLADLRDAVQTVVEPTALEQRTPFDDLVERAERRRRGRRRTVTVAAVAAAGVGLVLALPVAGRLTAPPATRTSPAPAGDRLFAQSLAFASVERGYAVLTRCPSGPYVCSARGTLIATGDGGRTWSRVPSPADNGAGERTSIDAVTETGGIVVSTGSSRYGSPDGGRTWTRLRDVLTRGPVTETIPAGWTVMVDAGRLAAYDPVTNQARPLAHQSPELKLADSWPVGTGPFHRLVLAGSDGAGITLAYTDDRGLTWHPIPVPPGIPATFTVVLTDPASERMYLEVGDDQGRLTGMWRLDRPGAGWVQVPLPGHVNTLSGAMKAVRMLPDGELAYQLPAPLRTEDGGTRAVVVEPVQVYGQLARLEYMGQSVGGTLYATVPTEIYQPTGVLTILVSTDGGRTWTLRQSHL
jgi:photosystem II stability/assembly factor-like uncharacterized protein